MNTDLKDLSTQSTLSPENQPQERSFGERLVLLKELGFEDAGLNARILTRFYKSEGDWPTVIDVLCRKRTHRQEREAERRKVCSDEEKAACKAKKLEKLRGKQERIKSKVSNSEAKLKFLNKLVDSIENGTPIPAEEWKAFKQERKAAKKDNKCLKRQRSEEFTSSDSSPRSERCQRRSEGRELWKQRKHEMKDERQRWKETRQSFRQGRGCHKRRSGSWKRDDSNSSSSSGASSEEEFCGWKQRKQEMKRAKRVMEAKKT